MARSLDDAPFVAFFDPEVEANREAVFAELRDRTSVVRNPLGVSVIRRAPIHRLLGDPRLVSSIPLLVRAQGVDEGRLHDLLGNTVIAVDGADHTRLRRLVSRSFTPRAAERHRPAMRAVVEELVDGSASTGRCELVEDVADRYPVQVICEVLGVPRDDHEQFARWGASLTYALSLELASHRDEVEAAAGALGTYLEALIADRQADPRDDLVTSLVQASEDGDRLTSDELLAMIGALLFAGIDTTRNQLGLAMATFCEHPDQWAILRDRPELVGRAVDEVMRLNGAVSGVPRLTLEEVVVDEWVIPAGTMVFLSVASANRDSSVYDDPLAFDITIEREAHLTIGGGPHFCLGSNLARAEMEEALVVLARRLPDVRLDGEPRWRAATGIAGPTHLPLAFTPT